ncbi:MAG: hypothetical protein KJO80_10915 [Gammaproteobacteria bacterium]|nr:hypothetical protein [Gammaproteobacteria bacterium]NNL00247.1 hypothetical protein [Xanthomonadales bacterium]
MKAFLRKNLMIVVSIALPLLVVILFALASLLPGWYSTPPEHDLLLSLQERSSAKTSSYRISLMVRDERLIARVAKSEAGNYDHNPRLFRYDRATGAVTEITIPVPEHADDLEDGVELAIPLLAETRISDSLRAPDGYEFRGRSRGGGLLTEMFGGSRNRTNVSIARDGAVFRVRLPTSDYWYSDVRFVGWVIE